MAKRDSQTIKCLLGSITFSNLRINYCRSSVVTKPFEYVKHFPGGVQSQKSILLLRTFIYSSRNKNYYLHIHIFLIVVMMNLQQDLDVAHNDIYLEFDCIILIPFVELDFCFKFLFESI